MSVSDNSKWIWNLLIIPLVVGIILAAVAFLLPRLFKDKLEVSYTIDGPTSYLDDPAVGSITVEVNGVKVEHLISYKVRIWNSGDLPLKELPVRFTFVPKGQFADFKIFSLTHDTTPPYEFGQVKNDFGDKNAPRVVYQLLNPGDQDIVTLLTNRKMDLNVYMKSEGMSANQVSEEGKLGLWEKYATIASLILGVIASILAGLLSLFGKTIRPLYNKYVTKKKV